MLWQVRIMNPEKLTKQTFDAITLNGPTNFFTGGYAKSSEASILIQNDNDKMIRMVFTPFIPDQIKFRPGQKAICSRENIGFP